MTKIHNIKMMLYGMILGVFLYILPIVLLKPDGHIIAYIYDPDILELYKQKKLNLKEDVKEVKRVKVHHIDIEESLNGLEII